MIRALVLFIFVAALAFLPVYFLDNAVLPQLAGLESVYGQAQATTDNMSGVDSATGMLSRGVDSN